MHYIKIKSTKVTDTYSVASFLYNEISCIIVKILVETRLRDIANESF